MVLTQSLSQTARSCASRDCRPDSASREGAVGDAGVVAGAEVGDCALVGVRVGRTSGTWMTAVGAAVDTIRTQYFWDLLMPDTAISPNWHPGRMTVTSIIKTTRNQVERIW